MIKVLLHWQRAVLTPWKLGSIPIWLVLEAPLGISVSPGLVGEMTEKQKSASRENELSSMEWANTENTELSAFKII